MSEAAARAPGSSGPLRHLRWALTAVLLVLAIALSISVIATHASIRQTLSLVTRAQGDGLLRTVRDATRGGAEPSQMVLDALVQQESARGLRCIATLGTDSAQIITAGDCLSTTELLRSERPAPEPELLTALGGRLRLLHRALANPPGPRDASGRPFPPRRRDGPPPRASDRGSGERRPRGRGPGERRFEGRRPETGPPGDRAAEDRAAGDSSPGERGPGDRSPGDRPPRDRKLQEPGHPGGPPPRERPLLIEYEPLLTRDLESSATRTLAFGLAAALALVAAAAVFWRLARRAERRTAERERERRLAGLGQMSSVMAHEMLNPLASMKGHAQLLAEALPSDGAERAKADRVVSEIGRLERLSSDLLRFVRSQTVERAPTDPGELLAEAIDAVAHRCTEHGVTIAANTDEAPARWSLDRAAIHRVLVNLLDNALQASPPGGRIEAAVRTASGRLLFTVRDEGPGIPEGSEVQIFEPFLTTRTRGTGLGLAVAQSVVRLHGGVITAGNQAGGGALLRVEIPEA